MPDTSRPRVLIVDDSTASIHVLANALESEFEMEFAKSGTEALARLMKAGPAPELILLDIEMPGLGGYEVCRHLKADPRTREIPVIFVTASNDPESEILALEAGAADFITKPVHPRIARLRVGLHLLLRQRERSLARLNAELEERVAERTRDLREALARAEVANRAKTAFLANISHEIRTPLSGIIGLAGLLRRKETDPDKIGRLDSLVQAGAKLNERLTGVLEIARLEAREVTLAERDFTREDLGERLRPAIAPAAAKGLAFSVDLSGLPARMRGDVDKLSQVLLPLLHNAVKFTDRGSVALVGRATSVPGEPGARLAFEVIDTGHGIPPEAFERIFQPFEQGDNSLTRKFSGSGLGLAIARQLADLMGGTVRVLSSSTAGSTLLAEVRLPVRP